MAPKTEEILCYGINVGSTVPWSHKLGELEDAGITVCTSDIVISHLLGGPKHPDVPYSEETHSRFSEYWSQAERFVDECGVFIALHGTDSGEYLICDPKTIRVSRPGVGSPDDLPDEKVSISDGFRRLLDLLGIDAEPGWLITSHERLS